MSEPNDNPKAEAPAKEHPKGTLLLAMLLLVLDVFIWLATGRDELVHANSVLQKSLWSMTPSGILQAFKLAQRECWDHLDQFGDHKKSGCDKEGDRTCRVQLGADGKTVVSSDWCGDEIPEKVRLVCGPRLASEKCYIGEPCQVELVAHAEVVSYKWCDETASDKFYVLCGPPSSPRKACRTHESNSFWKWWYGTHFVVHKTWGDGVLLFLVWIVGGIWMYRVWDNSFLAALLLGQLAGTIVVLPFAWLLDGLTYIFGALLGLIGWINVALGALVIFIVKGRELSKLWGKYAQTAKRAKS